MERRPINARNTSWASTLAKKLANLGVTPNQISVLSVLFSIAGFYFFYQAPYQPVLLWVCALCIQLRLICNLMDGMVAIEHSRKTVLGDLFNDIPDRFADTFLIMGVGVASDSADSLDFAWLCTALAIFTAYLRTLGASLGCPHYFTGPMAKPQRMALITVACVAQYFLQNISILHWALVIMLVGLLITCARRILLIAKDLRKRANKASS